MINKLLHSDLVELLLHSKYVKIVGGALAIFTMLLAAQFYIFFTGSEHSSVNTSQTSETIAVNVGEMFFEHADGRFSAGQLVAEVGDVIEFTNVGSLRHSVTIDEYDFDQVLNPGDSTTIVIDKVVNQARVNCRFHNGHEATLTVTDTGRSAAERGIAHSNDMIGTVDTSTLPVRSYKDAIDKLEFQVVDGVKEFYLTAEHIMWEYADGQVHESWGYMGQLPGPEIRVTEGDQVRVIFENKLPVATTVHWHGIDIDNAMDGVPMVTQDAIKPGETFVYEFIAEPVGTRFYHSHGSHHGDEGTQMDMGLAGPFIVEPIGYQAPDREYIMMLTEREDVGIYPINGRVYPNPEKFIVSEGDRVRVRMINAGSSTIHPMHLHGHQYEIAAIDGNDVPPGPRQLRNNQPLTPGEIYDIEFTANNPGIWVFHCHDLQHAAGGMIAELHYE